MMDFGDYIRVFFWWETAGLPSTLMYFGAYNHLKKTLDNAVPEERKTTFRTSVNTFIAGSIADFLSLCLWVPGDIISSRLQIQSKADPRSIRYANGFDAIRKIYREEGWRGFFRGFGISVFATAPASAFWWLTYDLVKNTFKNKGLQMQKNKANETTSTPNTEEGRRKNNVVDKDARLEDNPLVHCFAGAMAGGVAATIGNPLDLIKTRLQTQHHSNKDELYQNSWVGMKRLIKEEGAKALTKGMLPRILISMPASAMSFFLYELALKLSTIPPDKSNHHVKHDKQ